MADAKNKQTSSKDDAGQAEVQARSDEAEEKGYLGEVPPGPPNEAFSLESGPDSPTASEQLAYRADDA